VLTGVMAFESGVLAHFDCSLRANFTHTYQLRGTTGKIMVDEAFVIPPDQASTVRVWETNSAGAETTREISVAPANSYTLMADDFALALLDGRAPRWMPQDGVETMRVIDRLYASAAQ